MVVSNQVKLVEKNKQTGTYVFTSKYLSCQHRFHLTNSTTGSTIILLSKRDKLLNRMQNNPKGDWKIDNLKSIADYYGIEYADNGSSHIVFRSPYGEHLTVPAKRPIKPIYIRLFLDFIESVKEADI